MSDTVKQLIEEFGEDILNRVQSNMTEYPLMSPTMPCGLIRDMVDWKETEKEIAHYCLKPATICILAHISFQPVGTYHFAHVCDECYKKFLVRKEEINRWLEVNNSWPDII